MKKYISIFIIALLILLTGCTDKEMKDFMSQIETGNEEKLNLSYSEGFVNKSNVVLFEGITLNEEDRNIDISTISENELNKLKQKYNVTYKAYCDNSYLGEFKGEVEQRGLDWYWQVSFSEKMSGATIFIADSFNPYPRLSKTVNLNDYLCLNNVIENINKEFGVSVNLAELIIIDLDDDGFEEKIAYFIDNYSFSYFVCLLDKEENIVSFLMSLTEAGIPLNFQLNENLNIIDLDNDNIMEMAMRLPTYEGLNFNIYKYNNGNFNGEYINKCTIKP